MILHLNIRLTPLQNQKFMGSLPSWLAALYQVEAQPDSEEDELETRDVHGSHE